MNALKWSSKPSVCGASRLLASAATQAELWHWAGELSPCRNAQGNQLWLFKEMKKGQPAFAEELWNAFKQLQRCWNQKVPILCRIHFPNAFQQQSWSDKILFFSSFDWLYFSETGTLIRFVMSQRALTLTLGESQQLQQWLGLWPVVFYLYLPSSKHV